MKEIVYHASLSLYKWPGFQIKASHQQQNSHVKAEVWIGIIACVYMVQTTIEV